MAGNILPLTCDTLQADMQTDYFCQCCCRFM